MPASRMRAKSNKQAVDNYTLPLDTPAIDALPAELHTQASQLSEAFAAIETQRQQLIESKKRTSREIGECKRAGQDCSALIETMQASSRQLGDCEQ